MAQTPQSEETGGAGSATAPEAGRPQSLFGSSTTILLLIFAAAVFWWSRRRRVEMEERLRTQRREAEATAQQSALDVAHLMRTAPQPGAATAAAKEGLASAAVMPSAASAEPAAGAKIGARTPIEEGAPDLTQTPFSGTEHEAQARATERAEAVAAADRAAEEQGGRAARDAGMAGESAVRRMAAAEAAAEEAMADTAEAGHADLTAAIPTGAIAGDGSRAAHRTTRSKEMPSHAFFIGPARSPTRQRSRNTALTPWSRRKRLVFGNPGRVSSAHCNRRNNRSVDRYGAYQRYSICHVSSLVIKAMMPTPLQPTWARVMKHALEMSQR